MAKTETDSIVINKKVLIAVIAVVCAVVMAVVAVLAILALWFGITTLDDDKNAGKEESFKTAQVGDYIKFGSYEQDGKSSNGSEDIKWLVLAKHGDKLFVTSKYALDCMPYDSGYSDPLTWENCTLREWLNDDFLEDAFSEKEQKKISEIAILSSSEINNYFESEEDRICEATEYAIEQGTRTYPSRVGNGHACVYWVQTSDGYEMFASLISESGGHGAVPASNKYAVRPAMWISLE